MLNKTRATLHSVCTKSLIVSWYIFVVVLHPLKKFLSTRMTTSQGFACSCFWRLFAFSFYENYSSPSSVKRYRSHKHFHPAALKGSGVLWSLKLMTGQTKRCWRSHLFLGSFSNVVMQFICWDLRWVPLWKFAWLNIRIMAHIISRSILAFLSIFPKSKPS